MPAYGNITTADGVCLADALATDKLWYAIRDEVTKVERERSDGVISGVWTLIPWNGGVRVNGIPCQKLYVSQRKAMEHCAKLRAEWADEMVKVVEVLYQQEQEELKAKREKEKARRETGGPTAKLIKPMLDTLTTPADARSTADAQEVGGTDAGGRA